MTEQQRKSMAKKSRPTESSSEDSHVLKYRTPAADWLESLPVGNGQLGTMVFGDPISERLQLTEESIWAGPPVPITPPTAEDGIKKARELLFQNNFREAQELVEKEALSDGHVPRSQQPLGDLRINFHGRRVRNVLFAMAVGPDPRLQFENLENYQRSLDLRQGIARSSWTWEGTEQLGEVFCSHVDQVMVARYSSEKKSSLSCRIELGRESGATVETLGENGLVLRGQASHRGKQKGVCFGAVLKVIVQGGECVSDVDGLEIWAADEIVLVLGAQSDYNRNNPEQPFGLSLIEDAAKRVDEAIAYGYSELKMRHTKEHAELYSRAELDLGPTTCHESSVDERIKMALGGKRDPSLDALQFHYGRYLLICSSREGTLPSNLQGVWNHELAAPWNADYHTNINLQMNYWAAESTGLGECHDAFFDFMEGLIPSAQASAKAIGCRGAYVGVSTDVWKYTPFYGDARFGMWVMGLAWCSRHFMERYWHEMDLAFLEERAWPMLKECSLFFIDWLTVDPKTGKLVSGPSTSPENRFFSPSGEEVSLSMGCSMDQLIIHDCFTNTLEAAEALEKKEEWLDDLRSSLQNLALPQIASDGRLMEWIDEYPEVEPGHRHLSHAYGLHPGRLYSSGHSPEEFQAVERSIETRLAQTKGLVGWSNVWICHFYARLGQAEKAYQKLDDLRGELTRNLFGKGGPVFQIDHNLGFPSAVVELLVQSHHGKVHLLPALPKAWETGTVRGLRVRGAYEIELHWEGGNLSEAKITSKLGGELEVRYGNEDISLKFEEGESCTLLWAENSFKKA